LYTHLFKEQYYRIIENTLDMLNVNRLEVCSFDRCITPHKVAFKVALCLVKNLIYNWFWRLLCCGVIFLNILNSFTLFIKVVIKLLSSQYYALKCFATFRELVNAGFESFVWSNDNVVLYWVVLNENILNGFVILW